MLIDRSDDGFFLTGVIKVDELSKLLGLYVQRAAGEDWPRTANQIEVKLNDKNSWPLESVINQITVTVRHRGARRLAIAAPASEATVTELVPVHQEDDGA